MHSQRMVAHSVYLLLIAACIFSSESVRPVSHPRKRSSGHHSNSCAGRRRRCARGRQLAGELPFRVWKWRGGVYISDRQADQWGCPCPFKGKQHLSRLLTTSCKMHYSEAHMHSKTTGQLGNNVQVAFTVRTWPKDWKEIQNYSSSCLKQMTDDNWMF